VREPGAIDLAKESVELSSREETLAVFEFTVDRIGAASVSGLCRIAKPKSVSSSLRYLSLAFMVDAPDASASEHLDQVLTHLESKLPEATAPSIIEVMSIPSIDASPGGFLRQSELLLAESADEDQHFVTRELVPAIGQSPIRVGELMWWDSARGVPAAGSGQALDPSVTARVHGFLARYLTPRA
jgi:hypothetical protein